MLKKATKEEIEELKDSMYEMALKPTQVSYPVYYDGIKTKEEFIKNAERALNEENCELVLFILEKVEGWISYFWLEDDRYLQLECCVLNHSIKQALAELLTYLEEKFKGYTLYFGFPFENQEAIHYLSMQGFYNIEKSWNHSFFFDDYQSVEVDEHIERVTRENFTLFKQIYHPDEEAYWNCERIYATLDQWIIFIYRQNEECLGMVFLTENNRCFEIFGMEFVNDAIKEKIYIPLMLAALHECKQKEGKALTYFCAEDEKKYLSQLGFKCIGQYLLYIKMIG